MTEPPQSLQSSTLPRSNPPVHRTSGRAEAFMRQLTDSLFQRLCQGASLLVILLIVLLVTILVWKSWEAIQATGITFFETTTWDPHHRIFGAMPFIYGSVITSALAMLIAVPLGVGTAAFLSEIAPRSVKRVGAFFVELLAAVPSVVYGFWGLFVLAPAVQSLFDVLGGPNQGGVGILSAGLILSIMIVPYVSAVSLDVCQAVPQSQRAASYALGANRWQTIWSVVLPYARPGIIGGCFLALGRALGETMAVTMLIGNRTEISRSLFAMGNTIPSVIANEFTEATYDLYLSALVELGLVLLLVSVIVNTLARFLIWRIGRATPPAVAGKTSAWNWLKQFVGRFLPPLFLLLLPAWFFYPSIVRTVAGDDFSGPWEPLHIVLLAAFFLGCLQGISYLARVGMRRIFGEHRAAAIINQLMTCVLAACLAITVGALLLIFGYLVYEGVGALNWNFFTQLPAPVGETGGGMANAIAGSFMLVSVATLFAVPIGLAAAIYLAEYRSDRLGPAVRFVGELLGGVPSIVIGIFGYYLLVKPLGHFSGWAGSFALGVMMIPIVMRASEEALRLVPQSIRHASHALGASHSQTIIRVIVPAAFPAIVTAVFLAIARVIGETAPLLLTTLSNQYWPTSPNDQVPSLPYYIYNYAISPYEDWHRQGWAAAFILLVIVMILSFGARLILGRRSISASRME